MNIDINKELEHYNKIMRENKREPFKVSDIENIRKASMHRGRVDDIETIINALAVGYSLGYRGAMRDTFITGEKSPKCY